MARPNAVKSSKYRRKIDDMIANGETYTNIHKWLKKNGENISRQTISNYHKNDFNIHDTAVEIYNDHDSKENLKGAAKKQVDVLNYYDKLIKKGQETGFKEMSDKEIHDMATRAAKNKTDFLKDEPEAPTVNVYVDQIAKDKESLDKSKSFLDSIDPNKED